MDRLPTPSTDPVAAADAAVGTLRARAYRPGDERALVALFNRVFAARDPARRRTLEVWNWLYRDAPCGMRVAVVEDDHGRLLAHYAGVPLRLVVNGESVTGAHCIDSMVDPEARRGLRRDGPFLTVARRYYDAWGDRPSTYCNFGFPNRAAYRIGTARLAYRELFRPVPSLHYNLFEARPMPLLRGIATRSGITLRRVARFGTAVDALWLSLRAQYGVAIERDARYLNWRYVDAPYAYETCELVRDERLVGIAVFRRDWSGEPIHALVDFVAAVDDDGAFATALGHGLAAVDAGQQARFETWFPQRSPWFARALEFGLTSEPTPFTMVCRIEQRPHELDALRDGWFYTIGDTDVP